jgi:ABC-type uncharacterized transport system substrate-binding protein
MKRREFITLVGSAAAAMPLTARAQQPTERMRRIAVLANLPEDDPQMRARLSAFREGLERLGWSEGRNIRTDHRFAAATTMERVQALAHEVVDLKPDVILAHGTPAVRSLSQRTEAVPIVFVVVSEPVAQGIITSLARPGGNITGLSYLEPSLGAKWLELLKELAPHVAHVGIMFNPVTAPNADLFVRSIENAAPKFMVNAVAAPVHEPAEFETAIRRLASDLNFGLIFPPDVFTGTHRKAIFELATGYRLPAIYAFLNYAVEGGLIAYGVQIVDLYRRAADYVDRILRGVQPALLPVEQPTKFELAINLKTAKALGLTVPSSLLARADEVIE